MARASTTILAPLDPPNYYEWFDLSSRPLLKLALENATPAHSVKIEWLVDSFSDGCLTHRALSNYTQIFRVPFSPKWLKDEGRLETFGEAAKRAGEQMLDDIEKTLWYGKPQLAHDGDGWPIYSFCGGVLHYLKRCLYENDTVSLRELRPLTLLDHRGWSGNPEGEWLTEFSLQVNRGHYQRGMKPLFLPPKLEQPAKAWAQGASLDEES